MFPDGGFDAALLMGPLYHLLELSERQQALRDSAKKYPEWLLDHPEQVESMLANGANPNAEGFTDAYFAHPDEAAPLCEAAGFETLCRMGCEGVVAGGGRGGQGRS